MSKRGSAAAPVPPPLHSHLIKNLDFFLCTSTARPEQSASTPELWNQSQELGYSQYDLTFLTQNEKYLLPPPHISPETNQTNPERYFWSQQIHKTTVTCDTPEPEDRGWPQARTNTVSLLTHLKRKWSTELNLWRTISRRFQCARFTWQWVSFSYFYMRPARISIACEMLKTVEIRHTNNNTQNWGTYCPAATVIPACKALSVCHRLRYCPCFTLLSPAAAALTATFCPVLGVPAEADSSGEAGLRCGWRVWKRDIRRSDIHTLGTYEVDLRHKTQAGKKTHAFLLPHGCSFAPLLINSPKSCSKLILN